MPFYKGDKPVNRIEYKEGQLLGECFFIKSTKTVKKKRYALFKCKCGNEFEYIVDAIKRGLTKSCGCRQSLNGVSPQETHGFTKDTTKFKSEYTSWRKMKERCLNPGNWAYKYYGGKGVKICDRWLGEQGAANFVSDMGAKPSPNHTIDRFPNKNGDYEPGNCRWATTKEQSRNKTNNVYFTFKGLSLTPAEWEEKTGVKSGTLRRRIKHGWAIHLALTEPTDSCQRLHSIIKNGNKVRYAFGVTNQIAV